MDSLFLLLLLVVVLALAFDFLNGFHDAANAIATIVVTRTLTPGQAVILAGLANFMGYLSITLGMGSAILKTVGKGVVNLGQLSSSQDQMVIILAALSGAILWNIITWLLGLPTSSSHALIGGLLGSMLAAVGCSGLAQGNKLVLFSRTYANGDTASWGLFQTGDAASHWGTVTKAVHNHAETMTGFFTPALPTLPYDLIKTVAFIVIAPVLGMIAAALFTGLVLTLTRRLRPATANGWFRRLQLVSATWYSFGHGVNDAQKTMAIIMMAMIAWKPAVYSLDHPEHWVILSCYAAIGLGTMFGGWRIVKTMGTRITKIRAVEGFCAESAAGLVLMATAHWGVPVSTTHVISGSIMGVGAVEHAAKVRWITARNILWAWILTIPLTAAFTAVVYLALRFVIQGPGR